MEIRCDRVTVSLQPPKATGFSDLRQTVATARFCLLQRGRRGHQVPAIPGGQPLQQPHQGTPTRSITAPQRCHDHGASTELLATRFKSVRQIIHPAIGDQGLVGRQYAQQSAVGFGVEPSRPNRTARATFLSRIRQQDDRLELRLDQIVGHHRFPDLVRHPATGGPHTPARLQPLALGLHLADPVAAGHGGQHHVAGRSSQRFDLSRPDQFPDS